MVHCTMTPPRVFAILKVRHILQGMKQNKKHHISNIHLLYTLNILSLVAIVVLAIYGVLMWNAYKQVRDQPTVISKMIIEAVEGMTKPITLDPKTGDGYLYESRFVLPVSSDMQAFDFVYAYQSAQEEGAFPEMITLAYRPEIERAKVSVFNALNVEDSLSAVPKLQACARGYSVYFSLQSETENELVFEKTLKDRRRIFVYKEDACIEDNHEDVVAYLKQIESY